MWWIICPDWLKNKNATIYSINKKDKKCFQYVALVAFNHQKIKKDPQKITQIINKYNWEEIDVSSEKKMIGKIGEN